MNKELRILVIEDGPAELSRIDGELRKAGLHFQTQPVATRDELLRELGRQPDLILSAYEVPGLDGASALALAHEHCPDVPFIFVTGPRDEEAAAQALKSGATDYVLKERLNRLGPAVTRALRRTAEYHRLQEASRALRESEEQCRLLTDSVHDYAIMMLDADGCVTNWNAGAAEIFGYSHEEILGRHFSLLFLPDDPRQRPSVVLHATATEGRFATECWCARSNGARFLASLATTAVRNENGDLRGYSAVLRDVTEQKRAEADAARLAAIVQWSDDAIISKSLEGIITSWNHSAERLFGYTAAEALGRSLMLIIPPERADEEPEILRRLVRGEVIDHFETVRMKKNGTRINVSVSVSPIKDTTGQIIGASKLARDITERVRVETELKRSEARHTAILDAALDAIISIDQEGIVHEWNAAAARIFGYQRGVALNQKLEELVAPVDRTEEFRTNLTKVLATGLGSQPVEWEVRRADGSQFLAEFSITMILGVLPPQYMLVTRDISDRKRIEQEERRLAAELERRVTERTAQLEAANKDLEAFSYSVSHDLRAPLRQINGFLTVLRQRSGNALPAESRELMWNIEQAALRMGRLIDDLLAFSRLGFAELHKARVALQDLVLAVRTELTSEARPAAHWEIGPLPHVEADPTLLRFAIANLLDNALKYTRNQKEPRIEISATTGPDEVVVRVRDNGVGFDMQYAGKLFGVFQRLHRESEFEGTGIGLANVRRIVQRHGGRIWAESRPGAGATFYFTLPQPPDPKKHDILPHRTRR